MGHHRKYVDDAARSVGFAQALTDSFVPFSPDLQESYSSKPVAEKSMPML
jgi:hypothetical protein